MGRITDEMALIRAYANEGLSVGQCAIRFNVSCGPVRRVLDSYGITRDPGRRKPRINIDERSLVAAYLNQGLTVEACARKFGISAKAADRILDRHRVPRRPPPELTVSGKAVVSAYVDAGKSIQACSREFGISPSAVRRILDRHQVPRRPSRPRFAGINVAAVLAALNQEGQTIAGTAAAFGISRQTVERIRDSFPVPPAREDLITQCKAARILGTSSAELARKQEFWQLTVRRTPGGHRRYVRGDIEDLARRLSDQRGFLTVAQFAVARRVTQATVRSWIRAGRIDAIKRGKRAYLIRATDLATTADPL
jgi:excisionase family DNA binding protein